MWLSTAIIRNVRVLELDMSSIFAGGNDNAADDENDSNGSYDDYHECEFQLPCALYTCGSLEVLKLQGAFLVRVPCVVSLPKLTVVELVSVRYESDKCVPSLISGSPMPHTLAINRYHSDDGMNVCTISSPVLKCIRYVQSSCDDCDSEDDHNFKLEIDAPALECLFLKDFLLDEVTVGGLISLNEAGVDIRIEKAVELVQAFDNVKHLTLCNVNMKKLNFAIEKLSPSFDNLTKLAVRIECCQLGYFMSFIDVCAALKVLQIERIQSLPVHDNCWRAPTGPRCLLSSLNQVSYLEFEDQESEMALLKFILDHATVITRLEICCTAECPYLK